MSIPSQELSFPKAVMAYVEATNAHDAKAIAATFADAGIVHDEGRVHSGRPEIAAWAENTVAKYRMIMTPLAATAQGSKTVVKAKVSGTFPGSPLELTFNFSVGDDGIRELKVGA